MVQVGDAQRPFMRGIMIHSLMARGVPFDSAYQTAEAIREDLRDRGVVSSEALSREIEARLGSDVATAGLGVRDPIQVRASSGVDEPFSKGVLAQSLLAASLDIHDAFDVAQEIEIGLLRQRVEEIDRGELRRLTSEHLLRRFGETTAERYLVWRRFQDPNRPVIILLGGTTGAGKTSLALEVARRLGIRRLLSTDSIRQVMRLMLSAELMPALHASSFDAHHRMPASDEDEDPVIEGFLSQAHVVAVGVRAMIERAVAENASLVLDGVSLAPGVLDLDDYKDRAHVISLVVATLDENAFAGRFKARGDRQRLRGEHRYVENLEAILRIQDHYLELAERHGVPIVDNTSIEASVQLILRHVVETLRKETPLVEDSAAEIDPGPTDPDGAGTPPSNPPR